MVAQKSRYADSIKTLTAEDALPPYLLLLASSFSFCFKAGVILIIKISVFSVVGSFAMIKLFVYKYARINEKAAFKVPLYTTQARESQSILRLTWCF